MTTYIVTGSDTGIPRLPNDSVIAGKRPGQTFTATLDSGVEAELIAAGMIAKSPLSSPVVMLADGTLKAEDGRTFAGGGGGSSPFVGPAEDYTFLDGDMADPASWYGATPVKVMPTWTPTESGQLMLLPPIDRDGSSFDVYIWSGDRANVDYPDLTAASGTFSGSAVADRSSGQSPTLIDVVAGSPYTIILVDWSGTAGHTLNLSPLGTFGAYQFADVVAAILPRPLLLFGSAPLPSSAHAGFPGFWSNVANGWVQDAITELAIAYHSSTDAGDILPDPPSELRKASWINASAPTRHTPFGYVDHLPAGGHAGVQLQYLGAILGTAYHTVMDGIYGVIRLDGTASCVVSTLNPGANLTTALDGSSYNADDTFMDWAGASVQGTDLTADGTNNWIHSTAGGLVYIFSTLDIRPKGGDFPSFPG